ncbi:undecaprenyl-phosphate glucose phosphotransferase [Vibrio hepatarius]|uniref:undecaprenyl-phosphate glucose phosphotransferase n=1 Tax=Vibrio hepatarius TaxID=171383 RepID=UPI003736A4C8
MNGKRVVKFAEDGYAPLLKVLDFLIINFSIQSVIDANYGNETAIDFAVAFIIATCFLLFSEYCNVYSINVRKRIGASVARILVAAFFTFITVEVIKYFYGSNEGANINHLSKGWYYYLFALSIASVIAVRILILTVSRAVYRRYKKVKTVAIFGYTPTAIALEHQILALHSSRYLELELYAEKSEDEFGYITKSSYKGKFEQLLEKAKRNEIDEVYITLPMVEKDKITKYLAKLSDTTVDTFVVPDLHSYNLSSSRFESIGHMQALSVFGTPFDGFGALVKRIEDIIIGGIITLLISPILLVIAIGVKLSSPGPVLFKQDRYGLGGKKIKVWKFRSMSVMENDDEVKQATKSDPRVTKFGAFIRRTSLDELPQFFNVLQGSMSIVGPRPHAVAHNEEYRVIVDNYMIRHKIKPGITGWAQINGYRGETDTIYKMEKRVEYDIAYLQHWSLTWDIKIIFMTVFKGFVSETAY